jgi:hypothetical protein
MDWPADGGTVLAKSFLQAVSQDVVLLASFLRDNSFNRPP